MQVCSKQIQAGEASWECLLYDIQGRSYVYAKTHLRTHLDQKFGKFKILSQFWWSIDVMCTKPINLNPILTEFDDDRHPPVKGLLKYNFYNLPLPRLCLSWQKAQTLIMRRRILWRLIWVNAVCICYFFSCIQPFRQMRTLNFRLATPLAYMQPTKAQTSWASAQSDLCLCCLFLMQILAIVATVAQG